VRQLELDDGYGFLNGFKLLSNAFDGFLVTHGSFSAFQSSPHHTPG
jgi:hypothetical protein